MSIVGKMDLELGNTENNKIRWKKIIKEASWAWIHDDTWLYAENHGKLILCVQDENPERGKNEKRPKRINERRNEKLYWRLWSMPRRLKKKKKARKEKISFSFQPESGFY